MQLLVRNKVQDFARWYALFLADQSAAAEYGLTLASLWQSVDDPNNVFFLLNVKDRELADAFMARPESQDIGARAGVIDGEVFYIEAHADQSAD